MSGLFREVAALREGLRRGYVATLSIESRLQRLEKQAEGLYPTLTLADGQQIRYTDEEVMAALSAAIHQEEDHRLLPYFRQLDTTVEAVPSMIRLIKVLMESRERIQKEERTTTNE